jgi:putative ABC transport system permease protein
VPDIIDAAPEVLITGSVSYGNETFKPVILGFSADFLLTTLNVKLQRGIPFSEEDIRSRSFVVVIGSRVAEELFKGADPIGEYIQIKGRKFRVTGVFEQRGQVVFFDIDELVLVPYSTAQTYLSGFKYYNQIIVRASSAENVERAVYDIKTTLRELHGIEHPDDDDFSVQTQQGLVEQVSAIIGIFTIFLSLVVAISLVVGGIGIMNIMLVSVTERTREIGLRKAVGANSKNILTQFLLEAILLTSIGGILGIVIGSLLSLAGTFVIIKAWGIELEFSFPLYAAVLGIGSSGIIGIVFGLYPARKASLKSPIEALRYE